MTFSRPYLVRAVYEWITDNGFTPYLLATGTRPYCSVH
jgi:stringent starvation protein B